MEIKQSAGVEAPFLLLDSAGDPVPGASPTVFIRKPGGSFTATTNDAVEDDYGHYHIQLTADETNTPPYTLIHAEAAGALNADMKVDIAANIGSDIYSRLGSPVGASISADIAVVDGVADSINLKTVNLPASPAATGDAMTLTSGERQAVAVEVEGHLLDEGDAQMLINAIVGAIGNTNVDQAVLIAAIRADLERSGGVLAQILEDSGVTIPTLIEELNDYDGSDTTGVETLLARLTASRSDYLDKLNVSGTLAHSDAAATYRADVSALATSVALAAVKTILDRLNGLVEDSSGDRFTAKALEQAPAGGGGSGSATIEKQNQILAALTGSTIQVISPVSQSGNTITARAGDSWSITLAGLGDLSSASAIWFAVKSEPGEADGDSLLFIDLDDGLVFLNAETHAASDDGTLTVDDAETGNITIEVDEIATSQLVNVRSGSWALKTLTEAGDTRTISGGTFNIQPALISRIS